MTLIQVKLRRHVQQSSASREAASITEASRKHSGQPNAFGFIG